MTDEVMPRIVCARCDKPIQSVTVQGADNGVVRATVACHGEKKTVAWREGAARVVVFE